jgi:hypothetical protein
VRRVGNVIVLTTQITLVANRVMVRVGAGWILDNSDPLHSTNIFVKVF